MQSKGRDFAEYFCFTQKRRLTGGILKESDKNNCNLRRFSGRICSFQGAGGVYGGLGKKGFRFRRLVSRGGVGAGSFRIGPGPARSNLSVQKPGSGPRGGRYPPLLRRAYAAAECTGVCSDRPPRGVDTSRFETNVLFRLYHSRLGAPCTASWECLCGDSRSCDGVGGYKKGLSPIGQNEGVCCKKMQQIGAVREVCAEVLWFAQRTANKCAPFCAKKRPPGEPGDAKSV